VALDDFGTGYSSLGQLKSLPIDTLKIDRSFVTDLGKDAADLAIVESIIVLAESFGLDVVAEGVETVVAAQELLRLGCFQAEGHLFCPASPVSVLEPLVAAGSMSIPGVVTSPLRSQLSS
jgi:EAL domain-containing protein (putative c-di-GMP-specific phosphodiesterase class I)